MNQSVLHPAGPMAERILGLWDLMYWICAAVFVLVILALLAAVLRRRSKITDEEDLPGPPPPDTHRRLVKVIGAATAVTVVLLFVLLTDSVATGRATASLSSEGGEPLSLKLTGKQWWWQVEYVDPVPSQSITTANEIHIPVGRPVRIRT
jgi:cytochrome c oxidase subunit II